MDESANAMFLSLVYLMDRVLSDEPLLSMKTINQRLT
tara:strand:+ start:80 stop:190 length:111 start_codon:yes stop_codon:yes gene_type:complete